MKHFFAKTFAAALMLAVMPLLASAAQFYPVLSAPDWNASSITAAWTFNMHPPAEVTLYAWIGPEGTEMFGPGNQWRRNLYLGTIDAGSTLPFKVSKTFVYSDLGLVPNKVYAYILAGGTNQSSQLYGNSVTTELFACFTTNKGPQPCPTQNGGQPPQNPPTGPQNPPAANGLLFSLSSLIADPANLKVDLQGELTATGSAPVENAKVMVKYRLAGTQNLWSETTIFEGDISPNGVSFQSSFWSVGNDGTYEYSFYEVNSGKTWPGGTFSMKTTGNQVTIYGPNGPSTPPYSPIIGGTPTSSATSSIGSGTGGAAVDGKCTTLGNGGTVPVITASSANLCSKGTVSDFKGSGPWTWTCKGVNNGKDANCNAKPGKDNDYGTGFLKNPLAPGLDTFPEIFAAIVNNIILPVAIPFIAIMIIYSGFLFVSARKSGNVNDLDKAKQTLKYTLIGAGLILGAFVIANAIQSTVGELMGTTT